MIVGREIASTGGCTHVVRSRVFLTRLPSVVGDQNKMWGVHAEARFPLAAAVAAVAATAL